MPKSSLRNQERFQEKAKKDLTFWGMRAIILELPEAAGQYPGVAKFGIALEWGSRGR